MSDGHSLTEIIVRDRHCHFRCCCILTVGILGSASFLI